MISGDKATSSFGKGFITESDQMKAIYLKIRSKLPAS